MKVGIFLGGIPPKDGGEHSYEQELLVSFLTVSHESRHEYVILSPNDISGLSRDQHYDDSSNLLIPRESKLSCLLNYFFSGPFFFKLARKTSGLNRIIKKNKIDFIVFLSRAPEAPECPFITPLWDLQHRLQPWFPEVRENGVWEWRERLYLDILKKATFIITGTAEGQEEISCFYGISKNRIKILPLPTPDFCLTSTKERDRGDIQKFSIHGDYLLYPAQFWSHKNHINCIYALKILHQQYNLPLSLVFVGSDKGNLSYVQKSAYDQGLIPFVQYLGFVTQKDLIALYQNATALIFPTFFGPDNLPPLEAFALKCPVIASNVPGAYEQLDDAALLFDPKSPEDIAKAIVTLTDNPKLRSELIEKGFQRAIRWTGEHYFREIFSLLDDFESIRRCWE